MVKVTVRVDPPPSTRSRIRQPANEIVLEIWATRSEEADLAVQDGSNVYFVAAGSRVKIGWSKKVAARMAQLQVGSPEPLKLLGVMPGGRLAEKRLHERFAASRLSGEWFDATPELLAFVAANGANLHTGR
jgi:hypothetical protein